MSKYPRALLRLAQWFERQKRVLPWREDPSPYRVWISEIMLQQTQVVTVVPYFERFITRFPTLEALAQAEEAQVLSQWAGLGYYSRARNLHRSAQLILAQGHFPNTREGWLALPGIGNYTAGAILSIAFNQAEAILDGNVERVLSRLKRVGRQKGDQAFKSRLWRLSQIAVERGQALGVEPRVLNQALMELGATFCSPRKPKCLLCPLQEICEAAFSGEQDLYPPKKAAKNWIKIQEKMHCLIDHQGRVLLRKREKNEWRAGLWDFLGDSPEIKNQSAKLLGQVETRLVVTRHKITRITYVWRVETPPLLKAAEGELNLKWVNAKNPELAVGSGFKKALKQIEATFPEAWPQDLKPEAELTRSD